MKTKLFLGAALAASMAVPALAQTQTDRQLDIFGAPQGQQILPSQGNQVFDRVPVVGIFWDERCASVEYTFNTNQPANPGAPNEIPAATLAAIVQTGLDRWNANPSSYIEMNVTNQTDLGNRPRQALDFINEVTFITDPTFGALASSPSTSLTADSVFAPGDDIDGDGDSDVFDPSVEGINVCSDVDMDGDIEFPAGFYKAGTILDNDVQFNSQVVWETNPSTNGGADVDAVSTHEFGHSHGLSHSLINQISATDGTTSTMFPFIATNVPAAELATRTLHEDDLAASANIYREGQGTTPISLVTGGDIPFNVAYSLIEGEVEFSDGFPTVGASVSATNQTTGSIDAMVVAGEVTLFQDSSGSLFFFPEGFENGSYAIAVPANETYGTRIEAIDGTPVSAGRINNVEFIGSLAGLNAFPAEGFNIGDAPVEGNPQTVTPLAIGAFGTAGVDLVVNEEDIIAVAGTPDFITGAIIGANDIVYINQFDRADILARLANGDGILGGGIRTTLFQDVDETFSFSNIILGTAVIDGSGNFTNRTILRTTGPVLAEDSDLTRFDFSQPGLLRFDIKNALEANPNAELFVAARIANVQNGATSGFPLGFVLYDADTTGNSYLQLNEGAIQPFTFGNWNLELRAANDGSPVPPALQ